MTNTDLDTETRITLVLSLLKYNNVEPSVILQTLADCNGDVQATASLLNQSKKQTAKRKRVSSPSNNLKSWVIQPSKKSRSGSFTSAETEGSSEPREPARQMNLVGSSSNTKPATDLLTILRHPPSTSKKDLVAKLPPLTLSTPALVAKHTPCTLHPSVLPPDLACELFYTMLDLSRAWKRNKWWLFDRIVESPHKTSFFARRTNGLDDDENWQQAAQYWYNGRAVDPPATFPEPMERACQLIERVVNEEMSKRPRFELEYGEPGSSGSVWRANVAASNCYEGSKESVGWHSDQGTYLGPLATIASLSLGTARNFSLREVIPVQELETRAARTYHLPLQHNSLVIMHASCQEAFKHSVPPQNSIDLFRPAFPRNPGEAIEPSNCRINITFRFYRPDFRPTTTPKCRCGVPTILRPDMKHRGKDKTCKYWWTCYAGVQNDGKGCNFWKVLDMEGEGRGPCIGQRVFAGENSKKKLWRGCNR